MCGIFGYAGNITQDRDAFFKLLSGVAALSEARGTHSTGFAARYDSGHIIKDKLPIRSSQFILHSEKFLSINKNPPSTLIGHTRYSTQSPYIINNNNHPFEKEDFFLIHNGSVPSWKGIKSRLNLKLDSATDSEVIASLIQDDFKKKQSFLSASERALNEIWGNMAVAILVKDSPDIWLFRNLNPIHVFSIPRHYFGEDVKLFCSEHKFMTDAWKEVFGNNSTCPSSDYLSDNVVFRITSSPVMISGRPERYVRYTTVVKSPYKKSHSYTYNTTEKYHYYSTASSDTLDISKETAEDIKKKIDEGTNPDKIYIDGIGIGKHLELCKLIEDFIQDSVAAEIQNVGS